MGRLFRRLQYWLRREKVEAELAEEMAFHSQLAGRRAMGNTTVAAEDARAVWIWPWLESLGRDLMYGLRALRRQPGFTIVALVALGSGIGFNVSLFTAFNAIALKPWPVRDPAGIVKLDGGYSVTEARYLAEHARSLNGVIAVSYGNVKLEGQTFPVTYVTGNYFHVLGVDLQLGRGFRSDEDLPSAPQAVAVLSYATWQSRFGGDENIAGRQVRLDDVRFTVIGVASREFTGTDVNRTGAWLPVSSMILQRPRDPMARDFVLSPNQCCSMLAARLAPGVTREQARSETELVLNQFRSVSQLKPIRLELLTTSWLAQAGPKARRALPVFALMFVGVLLVLLLACANVGNLLLARAVARRHEIAVRLSLGGSRLRLVRQLLIESLTLALIASAIGVAIAGVLPNLVISRLTRNSLSAAIRPDFTVMLYAVLLAIVACAAFGLAPALYATRGRIAGALRPAGGDSHDRFSMRGFLLAVQVALSVILLTGAGMLFRGVERVGRMDLGFTVNGVSVISMDLPASSYDQSRVHDFSRQLKAQLEGAPGMPAIGFCDIPPLNRARGIRSFRLENEAPGMERNVTWHAVSPGYADVLGIPVVAGRNFSAGDGERSVAMVTESMARQYWPSESAVGKSIVSGETYQIVGVLKDTLTEGLEPGVSILYLPAGMNRGVPRILVRGNGAAAMERIGLIARNVEPRVQLSMEPLAEAREQTMEPGRIGAMMAGMLGLLAVVLAGIGMSGVFAYVVRQRTREIGIRMALGARPGDAVRLVLASSSWSLTGGLGVGLAGAVASSRVLSHILFGVSPGDPVAYAGVLVILVVTAIASAAAPARRAARVDPVKALRWE